MIERDGYRFGTLLVHGAIGRNAEGALTVPVFNTVSFLMDDLDHRERVKSTLSSAPYYSRGFNPTVSALETQVAAIESAPRALAFSSGMSAIATTLLTLARNAGHIIVSDKVFITTMKWLRDSYSPLGCQVTIADFSDPAKLDTAFRPNTRAIFFEEFTNPLLQVLDLEALVSLAHGHGALAVVDNTFASPALLRPVEYGADLVIHSATKYMSGHGRVLGGTLAGGPGDLMDEIAEHRRQAGTIIAPHNAAEILTGLQTLDLRITRMSHTADRLARLAEGHPATAQVNYPGLPSSVGHDIAARLTGGRYGGMFSLSLREPKKKAAVYDAFELILRATSLGDVASLVDSSMDPDVLRISTGIEDPEDLVADLDRALTAAL